MIRINSSGGAADMPLINSSNTNFVLVVLLMCRGKSEAVLNFWGRLQASGWFMKFPLAVFGRVVRERAMRRSGEQPWLATEIMIKMAAGCMGCCQLHETMMFLSYLHITPLPEEVWHDACNGRRTLLHHVRRQCKSKTCAKTAIMATALPHCFDPLLV